MKILYLIEYFYPYEHGGSERSVLLNAEKLTKKDITMYVYTANFGFNREEAWKQLKLIRFPLLLYKKSKTIKAVSPFIFTNILQQIIILLDLINTIIKKRIDIIHIQSSHLIPAGYFASFVLNKPCVVTVRDYQSLCPLGLCISKGNQYKSCTFVHFITRELHTYLDRYFQDSSILTRFFVILGALYGKLFSTISKVCLRNVQKVVCISYKEEKIFNTSGVKNTQVIYNSADVQVINKLKKKNQIVFVGRLSHGKGIQLLLNSYSLLHKVNKKIKLVIIGNGILKNNITEYVKKNNLVNYILFKGQKRYKETQSIIASSKLLVVPSLWEEPFGRVALESIMVKTPIVVTDRGALPEIVNKTKGGYISKADKKSLRNKILKALKRNRVLTKQINSNYQAIDRRFNREPVNKLLKLYFNL